MNTFFDKLSEVFGVEAPSMFKPRRCVYCRGRRPPTRTVFGGYAHRECVRGRKEGVR